MIAVFKHEIRNYFHTMTAYVFGAFLLAFTGMGATLYYLQAAVSNFEFVLASEALSLWPYPESSSSAAL